MRKMSESGKRVNKNQIAIVLTDGKSNVDPKRTITEARIAHKLGIDIVVIGWWHFIVHFIVHFISLFFNFILYKIFIFLHND